MKIARLTVQNFRCFGPEPTSFDLGANTVLIGANGSGKTAMLLALARLFGPGQAIRTLEKADFHVPQGKSHEELKTINVVIDCLLEVRDDDGFEAQREQATAWNQVFVADAGGQMFARARLEATWRAVSGQPEGEIDTELWWITTLDLAFQDDQRRRMHPNDRAMVQVQYVPGARTPERQLRNVSGTMLHRLFRALRWSDDAKAAVAAASESVQAALTKEKGIDLFHDAIQRGWKELYPHPTPDMPSLRFIGATLEDVLRQITMSFRPGPGGTEVGVDRLSDGEGSLFYFALVSAVFDLEAKLLEAHGSDDPAAEAIAGAVSLDELAPPTLTVFAVEEPESHLAPHFLGPIFAMLQRLATSPRAQVVVTSHAPSLLSRVDPVDVRHLKLLPTARRTEVRALALPPEKETAFKFVKEAVRAYPELYFARVVVLGEGDSEEVVLPRILRAHALDLDRNFVSIVPLGGRFVHHFWRLLHDLSIPHVTLLDLDWDRYGGGWGRVKYACKQLVERGTAWSALEAGLPRDPKAPQSGPLDLETLHTWTSPKLIEAWLTRLEEHDVFFSRPLDLDHAMLTALPAAYKGVSEDSIIPDDAGEKKELFDRALKAVLKAKGGKSGTKYNADALERFAWYDHLFLQRGKPLVHMLALAALDDASLKAGVPSVLERLSRRVVEKLA